MSEENRLGMGSYRVVHIPNPPREPFTYQTSFLAIAEIIADAIADYDLYLGESVISANAQDIEQLVDGEWETVDDREDQ